MHYHTTMPTVPSLAELVSQLDKVSEVPSEMIPAMLGDLEQLKAALWARLTVPSTNGAASDDRLLDVNEAAKKLGSSTDWLYRHAKKLPFTVRMGRPVRFSEAGIERYIRQRMGR